ncbi:MAG: EFR1 family ferrodoxin [Elusimicrobiaceae bacterium]|jgi:ferredoxin
MKSKQADLYYFSGTGNTLLAAQELRAALAENGVSVRLLRLEKSDPALADTSRAIGLAFPVAMSTYPFVWNFMRALPDANGTEAFMLATMAGGSFGLVGALKRTLAAKGYTPVGACEVRMPMNIFYVAGEAFAQRRKISGLAGVRAYARSLADGSATWPGKFILSDLAHWLYLLVIRSWKWQWHQRAFRFKVNGRLCNKCGLCGALCPVGNITFKPEPEFGLKCEYCMRCASYCPKQAIKTLFVYKDRTYKAAPLPYERVAD